MTFTLNELTEATEQARRDGAADYDRALQLACERIADSGQSYEEAKSVEGWKEFFLSKAQAG